MVINIMVSGLKIKEMARGFISGNVVTNIMANGLMIKGMVLE